MKIKHILIEGYCDGTIDEGDYPCGNTFILGIHCLACLKFSYCQCPNGIALSNDSGVIESIDDFIGFGGDMEPMAAEKRSECIEFWRNICKGKIKEAYDEYMRKKQGGNKI